MYAYSGKTDPAARAVVFENGAREVFATVSGWSGCDGDLASVSVDGTVATVELASKQDAINADALALRCSIFLPPVLSFMAISYSSRAVLLPVSSS